MLSMLEISRVFLASEIDLNNTRQQREDAALISQKCFATDLISVSWLCNGRNRMCIVV